MKAIQRVLFLCTGNSCRSQMAEGLLRSISGGSVEAHSAGTEPTGLNPLAVRVMSEIDIDISAQISENVEHYADEDFDCVITVCDRARVTCPVFPGGEQLHWSFDDPAEAKGSEEQQLPVFRRVRDEIRTHIEEFAHRQ